MKLLKKISNNVVYPKKLFIVGLILSLLSTIATLSLPLLIKDIISDFNKITNINLIIIAVGLIILNVICSFFAFYTLSKVGEIVIKEIRTKLWEKSLNLPVSYFDKNEPSDLVSRVVNDTTLVSEVLSTKLVDLITSVLTVLIGVTFLFILDAQLVLALIIIVPLTLFIIIPLGNKIFKLSYGEQEEYSNLTNFLSQKLSEIRLIKSFNAQNREFKVGVNSFNKLMEFGLKQSRIKAIVNPLLGLVSMLVFMGVVVFGIWRMHSGNLTNGEFIAFILYLFQIITPFIQMSEFVTDFQQANGASERIFKILEEQEEENIDSKNKRISNKMDLVFDNVDFSYDGLHSTLKNISFRVKQNSYVAIVGTSGSGKSTIFSLIERFYNPIRGDISIGGISTENMNIKEWRSLFSYVPQNNPLFSGSIFDNITYGIDRDIDMNQVIEAAKKANIHDFILSTPNGYETKLNTQGTNLSGGQKQRIAIARAFLKNSPYLLLDEATSSLDSDSESVITQSLTELVKQRTTIVIAHRLSTVINANEIIVINNGEIVNVGNHYELLEDSDFYKKMVSTYFNKPTSNKSL